MLNLRRPFHKQVLEPAGMPQTPSFGPPIFRTPLFTFDEGANSIEHFALYNEGSSFIAISPAIAFEELCCFSRSILSLSIFMAAKTASE